MAVSELIALPNLMCDLAEKLPQLPAPLWEKSRPWQSALPVLPMAQSLAPPRGFGALNVGWELKLLHAALDVMQEWCEGGEVAA